MQAKHAPTTCQDQTYLTIPELARTYAADNETMRRAVRRRRLRFSRFGYRILIRLKDFFEWQQRELEQ